MPEKILVNRFLFFRIWQMEEIFPGTIEALIAPA